MGEATRRGRRGGAGRTRQLLVLLSALERENDTLTREGVMERLGVGEDEAARLMDLLVEVAATEGSYVALAEGDDGRSVTLAYGGGTHGKQVRLTRGETFALLAAMDQVGIPEDDPTREQVRATLMSPAVEPADVERSSSPLGSVGEARTVGACVSAIVDGLALAMDYRGAGDPAPRVRSVVPRALRQREGAWYLDAWDLDRGAARVFRLDRMGRVRPAGPAPDVPTATGGHGEGPGRLVTLTFDSVEAMSVFDWHETERQALPDGRVRIRTPHLGGDWLARHVAACGRHVSCDDGEVSADAAAYARELLSASDEARGATSR